MVVEARGRRRLAKLTIEALSSVENETGDLQLLPVAAAGSSYVPMTAARADKSRNRMMSSGTGGKAAALLDRAEKDVSNKSTEKGEGKRGVSI